MPRPCLTEDLESAALPDDGPLAHVLRHPGRRDACVRLGDVSAALVLGLDGERELEQVIDDTEARHGHDAPALLVRLLAELGDRGLLRGVGDPGGSAAAARDGRSTAAAADVVEAGSSPLAGIFGPRRWRWRRAPAAIERIYRAGGWRLVTAAALIAYGLLSVVGVIAFALLLSRGGVTPLVVGGQLGLGVICFIGGRAALVVVHELAHGLTLNRFGRRVDGAGITLVAIFPYAYVDTSAAWLEPRRRRMAVSAAGPLSDLTLAGAAAIAALICHGVAAEVCYQLTLAGYLAALLNLNPCLERDGYYLLADALGLPGLRSAGLSSLAQSLAGRGTVTTPRLRWYGIAVIVWSILGSGLVIASLWGTLATLRAMVGHDVSLVLLLSLWLALLIPTGLLVGRPLSERVRRRSGSSPAAAAAAAGEAGSAAVEPARVGVGDRAGVGAAGAAGVGAAGAGGVGAGVRAGASVLGSGGLASEQAPIVRLARQALTDASLRQRIRALGPPPGFEALGQRELRSSVAGVILAAGGESLALTHLIDVTAPAVGHLADHIAADTSLDHIRSLLGLDGHPATVMTPRLAPSLVAPDASRQEPVLYEPAPRGGASGAAPDGGLANPEVANTGANPVDYDNAFGIGLALPAWPGNDAGPVAIAQWMAAGARSAGLPPELPVMAALVESDLNNNACCNADSRGYFQMRESIWNVGAWTGYAENPDLQLSWFIQEAVAVREEMVAAGDPSFGVHASDWGTWVADVENPAAQYRDRYALRLGEAQALLAPSKLSPNG